MKADDADGDCDGENCARNSPKSKRVCLKETPIKMKQQQSILLERSVKVSNLLPQRFMERTFCTFLEKLRIKNQICADEQTTILNVDMYCRDERHVCVEFINASVAEQMCKLKNCKYMKHDLVIESALYLSDTVIDDDSMGGIQEPPLCNSTPMNGFVQHMANLSPFLPRIENNNNPLIRSLEKEACDTSPCRRALAEKNESLVNEDNNNNAKKQVQKSRRNILNLYDKEPNCETPVKNPHDNIEKLLKNENSYKSKVQGENKGHNIFNPNQHKKQANDTAPGRRVLTENIDSPFIEEQFCKFVSKCLERKCKGIENENQQFRCGKYCSEKKSVVVEFESPTVASAFCSDMNFTEYMCEIWILTQLPDEPLGLCGPKDTPVVLSRKVLFENIDSPFDEENFSMFLSKCLQRKCQGISNENRKFTCDKYSCERKSVVVEFESPAVASAFCSDMNFTEYMCEIWILTQLPDEPLGLCGPKDKPVVLSRKVLFENIDSSFHEEIFSTFLSKCLERKCTGISNEDGQFKCGNYCSEKKSVVVEFKSHEVASLICERLQFIEYNLEPLTLTLCEIEKADELQDCSYGGPLGAILPIDEEGDEQIELSSEAGKAIFHEALLKTRNFFHTKSNHQSGYVQVLSYLQSKNVEGATLSAIAKMRRNLSNCYNTHKKNKNLIWPHFKLCEIIFDKGQIDDASSVQFGDALIPLEPTSISKMFTKGAVFTGESRSILIGILKDNVDAYREGRLNFWDKVRQFMEENGLYYSADDCKAEFKHLERDFKEIEMLRKKTGAPHRSYISNWKHYEEMREFSEADVAFHPAVTASVGSTSNVEFSVQQGNENNPKQSVSRLKKPTSRFDKKNATMMGILEQMTRSNDLKEKFLHKDQ